MKPPSLLSQALLLEALILNGGVDAYRVKRKMRPSEGEALTESLWATVAALREFHERGRAERAADP